MAEAVPKATSEHIPENLEQEMIALTGGEELLVIERAAGDLKREMAQARPVGRTIETTKRSEVVIPLESREQKGRILGILAQLAIYPWEERGLLIIDHHSDLRKLVIAGILSAPELSTEPTLPTAGLDLTFPLPVTETLSELSARRAGERRERDRAVSRTPDEDTDTTEPLDEELEEIVARFDSGLVDEDDPEFAHAAGSSFPSLRLFPRKYLWQGQRGNRTLLEAQTGKVISNEEQTKY